MSLSFLNYSLIILSIILIIILIIQGIKWKFKYEPFTRERFAFSGLTLLVSLIIYLIPYLFGNNLLIKIINLLSIAIFKTPIKIYEPDTSDKILAFLFVCFIGYIFIRIFNNWNGKKSIHQYELEKIRESTNLIKEAKAYFEVREKLNVFNPEIDENVFNLKEPEIESIAWHDQVYDLLTLSSNQYIINKNRDWYQKENCYISFYGKEMQPLAVMCSINEPTDKKIIDFIKFSIHQFSPKVKIEDLRFIVAIKNTNSSKFIKSFNNHNVEFTSEFELLNELIDFSNYYTYIKEQYENKEIIKGYSYTLKDVYTEPTCKIKQRNNEKDKDIEKTEEYVINWVNETKNKKHLAILGEYGQGKSVLSQRVAYIMIQNQKLTNRIPIIIELRGRYPKQYSNSLSMISDWCSNYSINPKALLKLHHAGRLLLIFEGFDEMELIGDYEIRVDHFRKLWGFSTLNSKIIITGRPNFFLNDNELKMLLRTSNEYSNLTYCEEIHLKRFSKFQLKTL